MKSNKHTFRWTLNMFHMWYAKCVNNDFNSHICSNFKTFTKFKLSGRKQRKWTWSKKLRDLFWLNISTKCILLWTQWWTFRNHKRWDIYWLAGWLSSSQRLYSIEFIRHKHVKVSAKIMLKILCGKQRMRNKIWFSARFLRISPFTKTVTCDENWVFQYNIKGMGLAWITLAS
jgi:hypothetical protein